MAIPSTGAVSMNTLATEFGGAKPHSLSEYYRGGAYVNSAVNSKVPTSGIISLNDFRGVAQIVPPVILYQGHANSTSRTINVPTAGDKIIYCCTGSENDRGGIMDSATIGGVPAVIQYQPSVSDTTGHFWRYMSNGQGGSTNISYSQYGGGSHFCWIIQNVKALHQGIAGGGSWNFTGMSASKMYAVIAGNRSRNSGGQHTFSASNANNVTAHPHFNSGNSTNYSIGGGSANINAGATSSNVSMSGGDVGYASMFTN
jgi:hypothetical protein